MEKYLIEMMKHLKTLAKYQLELAENQDKLAKAVEQLAENQRKLVASKSNSEMLDQIFKDLEKLERS